MPLEVAVRKMTEMPAKRLGLTDRGVLREGGIADVVIFDPATVKDNSTFAAPHQYPTGIETVIVNGVVAVLQSKPTGARAGRVLTRNSAPGVRRRGGSDTRSEMQRDLRRDMKSDTEITTKPESKTRTSSRN